MGAEHRVPQIQSEASAHVAQLNARHQEEISRIQLTANLAHGDLSLQLQQLEQYNIGPCSNNWNPNNRNWLNKGIGFRRCRPWFCHCRIS